MHVLFAALQVICGEEKQRVLEYDAKHVYLNQGIHPDMCLLEAGYPHGQRMGNPIHGSICPLRSDSVLVPGILSERQITGGLAFQ